MKPIVRWTIGGNSHQDGFRCLAISVLTWQKVYHDKFDLYICHNSLSPRQLREVSQLGTQLICQDDHIQSLPIRPGAGPEWKLYPPRISLDTEEVFVDNDLIIYRPLKMLNKSLSSRSIVASTAVGCSHGSFNKLQTDKPVNTGLMCFPRGYNLRDKIIEFLNQFSVDQWAKFCDEQGMISYILRNEAELIPMHILSTCHWCNETPRFGSCGAHFVGMNRGHSEHFRTFVRRTLI